MDQSKVDQTRRFLEARTRSDVSKAVLIGQTASGVKGLKKARCLDNDNGKLIPFGSEVFFIGVGAGELKPGRFVMVRRGSVQKVRRFIRYLHGDGALYVQVAAADGSLDEPVPSTMVLGQVVKVVNQGRTIDANRGAWLGRFTDYGTSSFVSWLGRFFSAFIPGSGAMDVYSMTEHKEHS